MSVVERVVLIAGRAERGILLRNVSLVIMLPSLPDRSKLVGIEIAKYVLLFQVLTAHRYRSVQKNVEVSFEMPARHAYERGNIGNATVRKRSDEVVVLLYDDVIGALGPALVEAL
jgi:hypothetical protein